MGNNMPSGDADGPKLNPKQTGNLHLEIQFRAALNANITILVWDEFKAPSTSITWVACSMIPACKGTELLVGWRPWNWSP